MVKVPWKFIPSFKDVRHHSHCSIVSEVRAQLPLTDWGLFGEIKSLVVDVHPDGFVDGGLVGVFIDLILTPVSRYLY